MYRQQLITAVQSAGFSLQVSLVCPPLPIPVKSCCDKYTPALLSR